MAPELLIHDATPVIPQSAEFQASHHNESEGFRAFRPALKDLRLFAVCLWICARPWSDADLNGTRSRVTLPIAFCKLFRGAPRRVRRDDRMCGESRRSESGRGDWIRTSDLSVPNRALYQAEPRPDRTLV